MRCNEYDTDKISGIIKEGMEELGVTPHGKILLKPNVVIAHPEVFPNAFTRKEFLDATISAIKEKATDVREIAVGERCGITLPTRWAFKNAGYLDVLKRHGIKPYYFDEVPQVPATLTKQGRLRSRIFIPKPVARCDFLINLPKFKAHPWSRMTLGLKNYIGLQDDRHRLVDHNLFLEHKIADLQEVIQPGFIAIDGIIAGQGTMLTPTPFAMNTIVMGTNSCAVDAVGCHMVNVDPHDIIHLQFASRRGFGPIDLEEIEISGDYPLEDVQAATKNFHFIFDRIDDYFGDGVNVTCTVGTFPEEHSPDYCWGGCPGALQEAMHILQAYYPNVYHEMKKIRYVVGEVDEPLDLDDDEKVIFAGNCTSWEGKIDGQPVKVESTYRSPGEVDEGRTRTNDMLLRTTSTLWNCIKNRKSRHITAKGCPVSVGDHVHYLSSLGKVGNPNFDSRMLLPVNIAYWQMRGNRLMNRFKTKNI